MSDNENNAESLRVAYRKLDQKVRKRFEAKYGKSIRVSRKDYKLIYCRALTGNGKDLAGLCDPQARTILVNIENEPIEETIIHEMWHGEAEESGLHQTSVWTGDLEEMVAEIIGKSISTNYTLKRKVSS